MSLDKLNKVVEQAIAVETLEQLWTMWPQAAVAGGAPRDWYLGRRINDIDFFICDSGVDEYTNLTRLKEDLEEVLGEEVEPLSDRQYEGQEFYGFETYRGGIKIQFLFHPKDLETTVAEFPINISRIWWDGVDYHTHHTFSYYTNYGYLVLGDGCPDGYLYKIEGKFPEATPAWGVAEFLRRLGGVRERIWFNNPPLAIPVDGLGVDVAEVMPVLNDGF